MFGNILAVGLCVACIAAPAQSQIANPTKSSMSNDSAEAEAAARGFLAAFDSMKQEQFSSALAPNVTVFMPGTAGRWTRVDGKAAVEAEFTRLFTTVRARFAAGGASGKPTLGIAARIRDLRVQVVAPGVAIISFHLGPDESVGRRTLVFVRGVDNVWRLIHMHASAATGGP